MTKRFEVVDEGDGQYHVDIGDGVLICWQSKRHGNGMTNWRVTIQAPTATGFAITGNNDRFNFATMTRQ
jgi:hypothetical protein